MRHILSYTRPELKAALTELGLKPFRAKQLWDWVHVRGVIDFDLMDNLPKSDRQKLVDNFSTFLPTITAEQHASDGVIKWLFKMHDGHEVESVFIPETTRGTLCISSQVGCTLTCRFCHTGTQGLSRNLTAEEIALQVWMARSRIDDWQGRDKPRKISNIVYMGMGEPLYNKDNVFKSCRIFMDEHGMGFGSRKITISTSGVVPEIPAIGEELGVNLAISIHASNNETRTKIMPINNKYDLGQLIESVKAFRLKETRKVTWEYIMLDGINDSEEDAKALVKLLNGIPSMVNLIPFNPWPGSPYKPSKPEQITKFYKQLQKMGMIAVIRKTRGEDILAACGQLRSETSKRNTVSLEFPTVVDVYGTEAQKQRIKVEITGAEA